MSRGCASRHILTACLFHCFTRKYPPRGVLFIYGQMYNDVNETDPHITAGLTEVSIMGKLLEDIESYWTNRAEGYSDQNKAELAGRQKNAWRDVICGHMPDKEKEDIKILDIGTGPGFFPIMLAQNGYRVNAVDYTPEMLVKAKENAGELNERITFARMDAKELDFEDDTFDVIISRNLTWVLEEPDKAYREWHRVLRSGGKMLNFDANWYRYLYDDKKKEGFEEDRANVAKSSFKDHNKAKGVDMEKMTEIAMQVPLSALDRPVWDRRVLTDIGFSGIRIDETIGERVWDAEEKLNYASTPMFMVVAQK